MSYTRSTVRSTFTRHHHAAYSAANMGITAAALASAASWAQVDVNHPLGVAAQLAAVLLAFAGTTWAGSRIINAASAGDRPKGDDVGAGLVAASASLAIGVYAGTGWTLVTAVAVVLAAVASLVAYRDARAVQATDRAIITRKLAARRQIGA